MKRKEQKAAIEVASHGLPYALFAPFRALALELASHRGSWCLFLLKFQHSQEEAQLPDAVKRFLPNAAMVDERKYDGCQQ